MTLDHTSYSQHKEYLDCPRSWYLNKLRGGEKRQTWYLPIGTAVHQMVEARLKGELNADGSVASTSLRAEDFFYPLIERQLEIEPDMSKWLAGGPADNPVVEDKALQQVIDCYERALEMLDEIEVWHVELDVSGNLPGLEVPCWAFADIIGEHKKHGPSIWDIKTGKQKPKDNFQLETYKALLMERDRLAWDEVKKGGFLMVNPAASKARPVDLSKVNPVEVGAKYQEVYAQMKEKIYKTNQGYQCKMCFQKDNCLQGGGVTNRSLYYDRSKHDGVPF